MTSRRVPHRLGIVAAIVVAASLADGRAQAEGPPSSTLGPLAASLEAARGPEAYNALRAVWREWDTSDPVDVEAAIARYAVDNRIPPAARVYANVMAAYARRRRGDLDGAERRIASLGFVRDWLVVGPFENQNHTGLGERYLPELELDGPIVLDRAYQGKVRPVAWRRVPDVSRLGWLDVGSMVRPNKDVCVFASTFVKSPQSRRASLFVGAAGAFKLYVDADEVLVDGGYRDLDADRFAVPVDLVGGEFHRLTVKVCGGESPPNLTLRIGGERGEPLTDVVVDASEHASTLAAKRLRAQRGKAAAKAPKRPGRGAGAPEGAIQAFDAWLRRAPEDAVALESYARYLATTGGDSEDGHEARDFATRAARRAPTVARLLLAAELAEDRNGRRAWIDEAERLVASPDERLSVLRAKVQLVASGPSPRDVAPLLRELERAEPHDPVARIGLVERFVEAGLPRTALAELSRALDVRPRSLALLRAAASELRALGRDAEALEFEERHAEFRFDDPTVLHRRLELAAARHDARGVADWSRALLRVDPTSPWAYAEVAKAQRRVGEGEAALSTLRRFLDVAPEDTGIRRALADLHGERGDKQAELAELRAIVRLTPQDTAARDYLEHLEPKKAREDERFAWTDDRFRELARATPTEGSALRVLRKLTVTTVFDSGLGSHFHQRVFQPLTEEAAKHARRFAFAFHGDRQSVELRGVRVFRKDGRIDETVTTGEGPLDDPSLNMYTLERMFYVQLPELHAGDIVDLRYRVDDVTVQSDMADYVAELETFREQVPVLAAEYVLVAPSQRKLNVHATGLPGLVETVTQQADRTVRRFEARDLAPVAIEPGAPPFAERLGYVHASSLPDWAAVGRWYAGLAKDKLEPDEDIRRLAETVTRGATDLESRVAAVYRYAATETRYVALEFGIEGIRPRRASLTHARGWGDCKDKAALIVAMLRALGIDAEMVLVRTGMRGRFDPTVASLAPFDHAIAYVPALDRYLDGTAEATGTGELPALDRGALALRISGGEGKLVTLPQVTGTPNREEREFALELASDGAIRFNGTIVTQGTNAAAWRRHYQVETTRRERVRSDLAALLDRVDVDAAGVEFGDLEALERPVTLKVRGRAVATRDGVGWSVAVGPRIQLVATFASLASRNTDVLLGAPRSSNERWTLNLPQGGRVLALPAAVVLDGPGVRFRQSVDVNGRQVVVTRAFDWHASRIEPASYAEWREFCRAVDAVGAPRVLVSR